MGAIRSRLRRWHVWLGWLVGLPFLFWTVSGLVMVARPIEEVRGEHLISPPKPISIAGPIVAPQLQGRQVLAVTLEPRADGPRWEIDFADGEKRLADPASHSLISAKTVFDSRAVLSFVALLFLTRAVQLPSTPPAFERKTACNPRS